MSHRSLVALLVPFFVFACGGTAEQGGNEGTGGADSSGGAAGSGGGSASGGTASGGSSTGGASGVCEALDDDAPGQLEVLIVNRRSTSIFLGSRNETCGAVAPFTLADEEGNALQWFADGCSSTCADLRDVGYLSCPDICLPPISTEVPAGESVSVSWSALLRLKSTLPVGCITHDYGPTEDTECRQAKRVQPGTFTFGAEAGTERACSQSFDPEGCEACTGGEDDGCSSVGALVGGELLTAEVTVNLDASFGVTADNDGADSAPLPGAINQVEIVFTE